jgi:hypothetical protein
MIPVKTASFSKTIPLPGGAFSAVSESMGFSISLIPSAQCIQLEVINGGSKDFGKKCLIPLVNVVKLELPTDPEASHGYHAVAYEDLSPQLCDHGGNGGEVVYQ